MSNIPGAQTTVRPVNNDGPEPVSTTYIKFKNEGLGGNPDGATLGGSVSQEQVSQAIIKQGIGGGCPVDPNGLSATVGVDKSTLPANPNAPFILTTEPDGPKSTFGNHLASTADKPVIKDGSWVGADAGCDKAKNPLCLKTMTKDDYDKIQAEKADKQTANDRAHDNANKSTGHIVKEAFKKALNFQINPDEDNGNNSVDLSFLESGKIDGKKSLYSDLGLNLDQFKSQGAYNLNSLQSELTKLAGGTTGSTGSGGQSGGGHSSGGVKTGDDGSGGGSSYDSKGAAPSSGHAAPLSALETLMSQFGIKELDAHLKDGSFDLDNFSAGAPSAKGPVLDLDGNGQQDIIEWALGQIVSEKVEAAMIEDFVNNAGFTEFHQAMMDKYADMFIA